MELLCASKIAKAFTLGGQSRSVLAEANLAIAAGEFVTILGPSGSGKSTLLNICGLIEPADAGSLVWQGQNLLSLTDVARTQFRRVHLGFIFQSFNLIPVMSVTDNVALPLLLLNWQKSKIRKRVAEVLEQVGLSRLAQAKPGQLSGGQCQRVAIARALVKKPNLIIADEPTASLDADTAVQVMSLLKTLMAEQNTACLVATHDYRLIPFCDRILRVEDKGVIAQPMNDEPQIKEGVAI